ncbi:MAG: DUF72 domain-containing protein [Chloroflexota bacterium]
MAARFWIGTSGWHYAHWQGLFYPEGLPTSRWLAHYIQHFPTVEINNSFYRQPKASAWQLWRRSVPDGFRFAVKVNRFITHIKRLKEPEEPVQRFLDGARLLEDRLGPLLYQLPPNFHRTPANEARLAAFLAILPPRLEHVFEFRHPSWFQEGVFDLLRRHHVGFCAFDMPGMECPLVATAPFAYVRFHGSEALYASNYTDDMLAGWAERLRRLAEGLSDVYVYFNNDAFAYAVYNARRLAELLAAPMTVVKD